MTERSLAEQLAGFVVAYTNDRVDSTQRRWAELRVLDSVVSAVAGLMTPSTRSVQRAFGSEPRGHATVIGGRPVADYGTAALMNGAAAHAVEFDDDHRTATVHPGAVVVPAALAAAERAGASGLTFLRAVLLGYEVMCRTGEAFLGRQYARGFHPTGTCGALGAAVAAGVASELTREQMVHAIAIGGTQACGLGEWRAGGSWIKHLHPGLAARNGLLAAQLAGAGFTGPNTILDGRDGFFRAFADEGSLDEGIVSRDLGVEFHALATAWKPYPCCRFAHGAIDLAVDAHRELDVDTVQSVSVRMFRADVLTTASSPQNAGDAQFALPYLVATALRRGRLTLADFQDAALRDPAVLALAASVQIVIDDAFSACYPERYTTELTVSSNKTGLWARSCHLPRGDPAAAVYEGDPGRCERELLQKVNTILSETGHEQWGVELLSAVGDLVGQSNLSAISHVIGSLGDEVHRIVSKEPPA